MTAPLPVLRSLPYFPTETAIVLGSERIAVRRYQIIVWLSIAGIGDDEPPTDPRRFHAILDTGHNDNFAISPRQLRDWVGIAWAGLPLEPGVERRYQTIPVPHRRANLWLHPNQFGWRDEFDPGLPPVLLELDAGIAVYGDGEQVGVTATTGLIGPRLPLLGLRALTTSRLRLRVEADTCSVWIDRVVKG